MFEFTSQADLERINLILAKHQSFYDDPEAWPAFLRSVAAGESPGHACERLGLNLFELNTWIRADQSTGPMNRRAMLDEALISRSEALKWALEDQLTAVAMFDIRKLFKDGFMIPIDQWPPEIGAAVASLDAEELFAHGKGPQELIGYLKKVKAWDKIKGIDMLGKQHGMFKDKAQERIADSLESLLAKSFKSE